jgi:multiple sugar transport system permease protein
MKKNTSSTINRAIKTVIIAFLALLFLIPMLWMISSSLKTTNRVFTSPFRWIPEDIRWVNYARVWKSKDMPMLRVFYNSLFISVVSTAGQLLFASMAAYAFSRIKFVGRNVLFILFLASMMIPTQVTIIPRFMLFRSIGLYNSFWALILPAFFGASTIFFLRQAYMSLPGELLDAAKVDGANHWLVFGRIMMPLTVAPMISMMVLSFVSMWNDYLNPLIFLTRPKVFVISQAIRWYMLDEVQRYELTMAVATSSILPIVIIFLFAQKYFIEGIAKSGIKG